MQFINTTEVTSLLNEQPTVEAARGWRLRRFAGAAGAVLLLGAVAAVAHFQVVTPSTAGLVVPAGTANVKFLEKGVTMKDEEEAPCDNATTPCPETASDPVYDEEEETPCTTTNTTTTPCPDVDGSGDVDEDIEAEAPCDNATTAAPCTDGKCKDGLFLSIDYTCVATCPSGFYGNKDSGDCTACIAGCSTCSDSLGCSKCNEGLEIFTEADGNVVCIVAITVPP